MIPFFVGYGVLMCVLAFRGRRSLLGFVTVLIGASVLLALGVVHAVFSRIGNLPSAVVVVGIIYYPYIVLVILISTWFVFLPRDRKLKGRCGKCGYDIESLKGRIEHCPECGNRVVRRPHSSREIAEYQRLKWNPQSSRAESDSASDSLDQSPDCADEQHRDRDAEDQPPTKPAEH